MRFVDVLVNISLASVLYPRSICASSQSNLTRELPNHGTLSDMYTKAHVNTANVDSSVANNATGELHTNVPAIPTAASTEMTANAMIGLITVQKLVSELYPPQPAPKPSTQTSASASQRQPSQTVTDTPSSPTAWQVPTKHVIRPPPGGAFVNLPFSPQSQSQAPIAQPKAPLPTPTPSPPSQTPTSIATSTKVPFPISNSSILTNNNNIFTISAPATPLTINHTLSLTPSTAVVVKTVTATAGLTLVVSGITLALPAGATNVVIDGTTTAGLGDFILSGLGIAAPTGSGNGSVALTGGASQLADGEGLSWWIGVVVVVGGVYLRLRL